MEIPNMELKRRSFFSGLLASPLAFLFTSKAKAEPKVVELRDGYSQFPVDIRTIPQATGIEAPPLPKLIERNNGTAFGLSPIDETRLSELITFGRSIGFCFQTIDIAVKFDNYTFVTLKFGQISDPRVPKEELVINQRKDYFRY
jgi:hypothetical protein